MTALSKKQLSQLHNALIKESKNNLSGAVKLYCAMFGKQSDLKSVVDSLNSSGINVLPSVVKAVVDMAKNKDEVMKVCAQMLPNIDGTYVKFVTYEKTYFDVKEADKNIAGDKKILDEKAVSGVSYKAFGLCNPIDIKEGDTGYYFIKTQNESYSTVKVAVKLTSYSIALVAKCVIAYLSAEDKDR